MTDKPKTFAITRKEGGNWLPFAHDPRPPDIEGWKVHSILFEDGSIWDASGGWREHGYSAERMGGISQKWSLGVEA